MIRKVIIGLVSSKKFWLTATTVLVYVAGRIGLKIEFDSLWPVMTSLMSLAGLYAVEDHGKAAAKLSIAKNSDKLMIFPDEDIMEEVGEQ